MRTVKTAIYNLFICLFAHPTNEQEVSRLFLLPCLYVMFILRFRKGNNRNKGETVKGGGNDPISFLFPVQVACCCCSIPSIQFIATTSSAPFNSVNHHHCFDEWDIVNQRLTANFGISHTFTVDFDICYRTSK